MKFNEWKRLITSKEAYERSVAADEIPERTSPKRAIPYLIACLNDEDEMVRTCAADTLGFYREPAAREALRQALKVETDELTRAYLLSALGSIGTLEDLPLIARHVTGKANSLVEVHAAMGLTLLAQRKWIEVTGFGLKNKDDDIRATSVTDMKDFVRISFEVIEDLASNIAPLVDNERVRATQESMQSILSMAKSIVKKESSPNSS